MVLNRANSSARGGKWVQQGSKQSSAEPLQSGGDSINLKTKSKELHQSAVEHQPTTENNNNEPATTSNTKNTTTSSSSYRDHRENNPMNRTVEYSLTDDSEKWVAVQGDVYTSELEYFNSPSSELFSTSDHQLEPTFSFSRGLSHGGQNKSAGSSGANSCPIEEKTPLNLCAALCFDDEPRRDAEAGTLKQGASKKTNSSGPLAVEKKAAANLGSSAEAEQSAPGPAPGPSGANVLVPNAGEMKENKSKATSSDSAPAAAVQDDGSSFVPPPQSQVSGASGSSHVDWRLRKTAGQHHPEPRKTGDGAGQHHIGVRHHPTSRKQLKYADHSGKSWDRDGKWDKDYSGHNDSSTTSRSNRWANLGGGKPRSSPQRGGEGESSSRGNNATSGETTSKHRLPTPPPPPALFGVSLRNKSSTTSTMNLKGSPQHGHSLKKEERQKFLDRALSTAAAKGQKQTTEAVEQSSNINLNSSTNAEIAEQGEILGIETTFETKTPVDQVSNTSGSADHHRKLYPTQSIESSDADFGPKSCGGPNSCGSGPKSWGKVVSPKANTWQTEDYDGASTNDDLSQKGPGSGVSSGQGGKEYRITNVYANAATGEEQQQQQQVVGGHNMIDNQHFGGGAPAPSSGVGASACFGGGSSTEASVFAPAQPVFPVSAQNMMGAASQNQMDLIDGSSCTGSLGHHPHTLHPHLPRQQQPVPASIATTSPGNSSTGETTGNNMGNNTMTSATSSSVVYPSKLMSSSASTSTGIQATSIMMPSGSPAAGTTTSSLMMQQLPSGSSPAVVGAGGTSCEQWRGPAEAATGLTNQILNSILSSGSGCSSSASLSMSMSIPSMSNPSPVAAADPLFAFTPIAPGAIPQKPEENKIDRALLSSRQGSCASGSGSCPAAQMQSQTMGSCLSSSSMGMSSTGPMSSLGPMSSMGPMNGAAVSMGGGTTSSCMNMMNNMTMNSMNMNSGQQQFLGLPSQLPSMSESPNTSAASVAEHQGSQGPSNFNLNPFTMSNLGGGISTTCGGMNNANIEGINMNQSQVGHQMMNHIPQPGGVGAGGNQMSCGGPQGLYNNSSSGTMVGNQMLNTSDHRMPNAIGNGASLQQPQMTNSSGFMNNVPQPQHVDLNNTSQPPAATNNDMNRTSGTQVQQSQNQNPGPAAQVQMNLNHLLNLGGCNTSSITAFPSTGNGMGLGSLRTGSGTELGDFFCPNLNAALYNNNPQRIGDEGPAGSALNRENSFLATNTKLSISAVEFVPGASLHQQSLSTTSCPINQNAATLSMGAESSSFTTPLAMQSGSACRSSGSPAELLSMTHRSPADRHPSGSPAESFTQRSGSGSSTDKTSSTVLMDFDIDLKGELNRQKAEDLIRMDSMSSLSAAQLSPAESTQSFVTSEPNVPLAAEGGNMGGTAEGMTPRGNNKNTTASSGKTVSTPTVSAWTSKGNKESKAFEASETPRNKTPKQDPAAAAGGKQDAAAAAGGEGEGALKEKKGSTSPTEAAGGSKESGNKDNKSKGTKASKKGEYTPGSKKGEYTPAGSKKGEHTPKGKGKGKKTSFSTSWNNGTSNSVFEKPEKTGSLSSKQPSYASSNESLKEKSESQQNNTIQSQEAAGNGFASSGIGGAEDGKEQQQGSQHRMQSCATTAGGLTTGGSSMGGSFLDPSSSFISQGDNSNSFIMQQGNNQLAQQNMNTAVVGDMGGMGMGLNNMSVNMHQPQVAPFQGGMNNMHQQEPGMNMNMMSPSHQGPPQVPDFAFLPPTPGGFATPSGPPLPTTSSFGGDHVTSASSEGPPLCRYYKRVNVSSYTHPMMGAWTPQTNSSNAQQHNSSSGGKVVLTAGCARGAKCGFRHAEPVDVEEIAEYERICADAEGYLKEYTTTITSSDNDNGHQVVLLNKKGDAGRVALAKVSVWDNREKAEDGVGTAAKAMFERNFDAGSAGRVDVSVKNC